MSRNPLCITKACPTLESLDAENVYFKTPLNLAELLPNLRSLDLVSIIATDPSFIEVNLPRLEHFGITLCDDQDFEHLNEYDDDDGSDIYAEAIGLPPGFWRKPRYETDVIGTHIEVKNIENAFIYNPQLRSIALDMVDIDMALVEFINTTLPNLKKIELSLFADAAKNHSSINGIVFKSVTDASLGRLGGKKPPINFKQLKTLGFDTVACKATVDFISKHRQLTKLTMICEYTDKYALEVVKALPNLQELNLIIDNHKKWSAAGLVRFLAICEKLQNLSLMVDVDSGNHKNWRSYVSDTWKIENKYTEDFHVIGKGNNK